MKIKRKIKAPRSVEWELRGEPEIESAVRTVRDMEDEEIVDAIVAGSAHLAAHADFFGAEVLLETARRWKAEKRRADK